MPNFNKILVTGNFGFIGSNLCNELERRYPNAEIHGIDKLNYAANTLNVKNPVIVSHTKTGQIAQVDTETLFKTNQYDIIFHLAAESHVDKSIAAPLLFTMANTHDTHLLLEDVRNFSPNSRFIMVSTDEVYGDLDYTQPNDKFQEDWLLQPHSPYAASKAACDLMALAYHHTFGLDVIVTRCSNNYGPRQDKTKLIPKVISSIISGEKVPYYNNGKNERDWLFVYDHVDGLIKAAERGFAGSIYNFGTGISKPNSAVVFQLYTIADKTAELEHVADRLGHDRVYRVDSTKAQQELLWKPSTDLESGLRKTYSWYLKHKSWLNG